MSILAVCGSASLWCGPWSGSCLSFDAVPDPDPTFHADPDPGSKPWKSAQKGSYSVQFGLSCENWCGSGSSLTSLWCRSGSGRDPTGTYHSFDADPSGSAITGYTPKSVMIFFQARRRLEDETFGYPRHVKKLWRGKNIGKCTSTEGKPHSCCRCQFVTQVLLNKGNLESHLTVRTGKKFS
jgi:hypothetical protein